MAGHRHRQLALAVYSPTTNLTYDASCTTDQATVNCSATGATGNSLFVTFPLWAIQAY